MLYLAWFFIILFVLEETIVLIVKRIVNGSFKIERWLVKQIKKINIQLPFSKKMIKKEESSH